MKHIIELSDKTVFKNPKHSEPENFIDRIVVKSIIIKGEKIGFVTNDVSGIIMLAGGGAKSTDLKREIKREILEETFLKVTVSKKIGTSTSLRNKIAKKYIVHIFECEVIEKVNEDLRKEDEKKVNLKPIFLKPETALHRMELQKKSVEAGVYTEHYNANFNILRDYAVLKKYLHK